MMVFVVEPILKLRGAIFPLVFLSEDWPLPVWEEVSEGQLDGSSLLNIRLGYQKHLPPWFDCQDPFPHYWFYPFCALLRRTPVVSLVFGHTASRRALASTRLQFSSSGLHHNSP